MEDQKQCMVTRMAVANGFQIRHFLRAAPEEGLLSGWVFLFGNEDQKYSGNFDNYVTVKLKTIIEHNPAVVPYLDFPDGSEFIIDDNSGQVIPLHEEPEPEPSEAPIPEPAQDACVPDMEPDSPKAESPAPVPNPLLQDGNIPENQEDSRQDFQPRRTKMPKVGINPLVWIKHYPLWPAILGLCWIPPVFIMFFSSLMVGAILMGASFAATALYWNAVYAKFRKAMAVPAIVISTSPPLAAVTMNLSRGQSKCPAFRVTKLPVTKAELQSVKTGQRLAAVAKRHGKENKDGQPQWEDFSFVPAHCATHDQETLARLLRSFSSRQWEELEARIKKLPSPYEVGLYKMPGK